MTVAMTQGNKQHEAAAAAHELCLILSDLNFVARHQRQELVVTPDSFARPNFELVCQLLAWCLATLDPTAAAAGADDKPPRCDKYRPNDVPEPLHVDHLKALGRRFHELLGVRLDLLALYRADAASCVELLKLVGPIHEAAQLVVSSRSRLLKDAAWLAEERAACERQFARLAEHIGGETKLQDDEARRSLVELVGALERLLGEEERNQRERARVLEGGRLEADLVARVLEGSRAKLRASADELAGQNAGLEADLSRLDEKLAGKELELSEAQAKANELMLLQAPAYVERQAQLRKQYEDAYDQYIGTYRTLTHLKACLYESGGDDDEDDEDDEVDGKLIEMEASEELATLQGGGNNLSRLVNLSGAGGAQLAKPSELAGASGGLLKELLEAEEEEIEEGTLFEGLSTGPARLLESLFEAAGMSKPMSTSFTTAGPSAPAEVGRGRAVVGAAARGGAAVATGAGGGGGSSAAAGREAGLLSAGLDAGHELDVLMDEFGQFDGAGAGAATSPTTALADDEGDEEADELDSIESNGEEEEDEDDEEDEEEDGGAG